MSSAGLLNGLILNGTIRYTFAGCVAISAQAQAFGFEPTRIVLPEGQVQAESASSPATATRTAFMSGVAAGLCDAPEVDAWKITRVPAEKMEPEAEASATAVRQTLMESSEEAVSQSSAALSRTAFAGNSPKPHDRTLNGFAIGGSWWSQDGVPGTADISISASVLSTRIIVPSSPALSGEAVTAELAYDLTRWMTPSPVIGRALTFNKGGDTEVLTVNQQYARGTGIARASSRGLHSAILAKSLTYAVASSSLSPESVYVARDAAGSRASAESLASGQISQSHSAASLALAEAGMVCSPSFYLGGSEHKTSFAWAKAFATAEISRPNAVRIPQMTGVRQPAWAEMGVVPFIEADAHGVASAKADSFSQSGQIGVTHLVWANAKSSAHASATAPTANRSRLAFSLAESAAEATISPRIWNAVGAQSSSEALAESLEVSVTRYAKAQSEASAACLLSDSAYKIADASGTAVADGATASNAVAGLARRVTSSAEAMAAANRFYFTKTTTAVLSPATASAESSAEFENATRSADPDQAECRAQIALPWASLKSEKGARRLRWIYSEPESAVGLAGLGRNVFKINADEPAPDRRSLRVVAAARQMDIPHTSREYRV